MVRRSCTVFYRMPGVYEAILEALRGERINLLVASGADEDPARFRSQQANVYIERYLGWRSGMCLVDVVWHDAQTQVLIDSDQPELEQLVAGKAGLAVW